jgi:hypothetical protein
MNPRDSWNFASSPIYTLRAREHASYIRNDQIQAVDLVENGTDEFRDAASSGVDVMVGILRERMRVMVRASLAGNYSMSPHDHTSYFSQLHG